jgi:hypothetical protein
VNWRTREQDMALGWWLIEYGLGVLCLGFFLFMFAIPGWIALPWGAVFHAWMMRRNPERRRPGDLP